MSDRFTCYCRILLLLKAAPQRSQSILKKAMVNFEYNSYLLALTIADFILATLTVLGNFLLLTTIKLDPVRCLRTPATYLIANLSLSDLFVGLIIGYGRGLVGCFMYKDETQPSWINLAINVAGGASIINGIWTVIAMALDRYIAVTDPFHYNERITGRKVHTYIFVSWVMATTLTAFYPLAGQIWAVILLVFSHTHFTIPVFVLLFVYRRIFCSLSARRYELQRLTTSLSTITLRHALERERKMALTSFVILKLFCASFLPFYIKIQLLNFCSCQDTMAFRRFDLISHTFLYLSSFANPFMYAWRVPKFRRSLQECLHIKKRNSVRPININ